MKNLKEYNYNNKYNNNINNNNNSNSKQIVNKIVNIKIGVNNNLFKEYQTLKKLILN